MNSKIFQIRETRKAHHNLAPRVPIYRAKDKIIFRGQPEEHFKEGDYTNGPVWNGLGVSVCPSNDVMVVLNQKVNT